ncbi:unnamed protein product [Adineta steineri]|uniref:Uncharacterized protein n=1 Tax=Adineta steineri TaxID=433720 RepID=A0A813WYH3_9BILA|nr:unnamed protein product [Adineta steineri]
MAMANNKTLCFTCNKDKITYLCEGCLKNFCLMDLTKHRQILNQELHHIITDHHQFKQIFNEQKPNLDDLSLIDQINQWEKNSIDKIKQKAKDCIEIKFTKEFNNSSNLSIQQDSQSFINDISIILSKISKFNKWKENAITVAGGNGQGQQLNQLYYPYGIFIDEKKNILIADCLNNRIIAWECNAHVGKIIAGGNKEGNRMNQLNGPRDVIVDQQSHSIIITDYDNRRVIQWLNQNQQILIEDIDCFGLAIDKNGFLYVSDWKKNEVRRWKMGEYNNKGIVVAGGNGQGNKLNQLNYPTFIFVDEDESVYVSDTNNSRVMNWRKDAKEGRVVAGGNGEGRNLNQLSSPEGLIVDNLGQIYVADCWNDRIMRWCEGKEKGEIVVGGNGQGNQTHQVNRPMGLSFDDEGNLYVVDSWNHRIEKFEIIL